MAKALLVLLSVSALAWFFGWWPVIFGVLLALLVGHGTLKALGLLCLLALPLGARADLLDDIPECQVEDCELVNRPAKPIGLLLALLLAVFGGCGPSDPCPVEPQQWTTLGIGIYVDGGAAKWAHAPDLTDRIDRIAVAVTVYAGHDAADLGGWVLVLRLGETVQCGQWMREGCTHSGGAWIEIATRMEYSEEMSIPLIGHEMLHALIGDQQHESPLWANLWLDCLSHID